MIYPKISILQTPFVDIQLRRTLDQYKEVSCFYLVHIYLYSAGRADQKRFIVLDAYFWLKLLSCQVFPYVQLWPQMFILVHPYSLIVSIDIHTTFLMIFFFWPMFRPDGEKKAYVRLAPDYDALDVANKVSLKSSNTKLFGFESYFSST